MGGEQPPDSAATVVDAQENVSPTGDRTNESDVDDTLTSAKENPRYAPPVTESRMGHAALFRRRRFFRRSKPVAPPKKPTSSVNIQTPT